MSAVQVSIVIKALNEERHIGRALASALRALEKVSGEVILADSHSTDRTVEIAQTYPVRIIQLRHPEQRCCGIGAQLGYQQAQGNFVYVMDGDMVLYDDFLPQALAYLAQHPEVAGVGGLVVEQNLESLEFQARMKRDKDDLKPGQVDRLDGGGLYRRSAIEQVAYLTDRNLHSYEEFDLAIRLRAAGWSLCRIDVPAVDHYGHQLPAFELMRRRWRSRYILGAGEALRAALGRRHLPLLLRELREVQLGLAMLAWWSALVVLWWLPLGATGQLSLFAGLLLFPPLAMVLKKRSLVFGLYSIFSWSVSAVGLLRGLVQPRRQPDGQIEVDSLGLASSSAAACQTKGAGSI